MAIAGTYDVTVQTPLGLQVGSLLLRVADGTLSGTLESPKGESEFAGGTVMGNEIQFTARIHTPVGRIKARITGTVDGDKFIGEAKLPLGTAQIEGERRGES